jgi:ribosomal protein S18 acetylase RimI-like enzyme
MRIRPVRSEDRSIVLALTERLSAFGPPPWRTSEEVHRREIRELTRAIDRLKPEEALFVAEDATGAIAGFIYLETRTDYFNERPHGHIGVIVVAGEAEGSGVGRALLEQAEAWSRERGYGWITLTAFHGNARARQIYERNGYQSELITYRKALTP